MDPASLHLLHKTRWVHHTRPVNPFTHLDQAIKVKKKHLGRILDFKNYTDLDILIINNIDNNCCTVHTIHGDF